MNTNWKDAYKLTTILNDTSIGCQLTSVMEGDHCEPHVDVIGAGQGGD